MKNLKKNMKNLKTKYGGTPQFILWYLFFYNEWKHK